jgi:hypothetical protein
MSTCSTAAETAKLVLHKMTNEFAVGRKPRMPADPSFERLLQLGRQQGGLTPHDLQQVLDVDRKRGRIESELYMRP